MALGQFILERTLRSQMIRHWFSYADHAIDVPKLVKPVLCSQVVHSFRMIKRRCGSAKVCYQDLAMGTAYLRVRFADAGPGGHLRGVLGCESPCVGHKLGTVRTWVRARGGGGLPKLLKLIDKDGGPGRTRTCDQRIMSPLL
jgi:hypothetical protein